MKNKIRKFFKWANIVVACYAIVTNQLLIATILLLNFNTMDVEDRVTELELKV